MIDKTLEIARLREDLMIQQENVKKAIQRCFDLEQELQRLRVENQKLRHDADGLRQVIEFNKHVTNKLREQLDAKNNKGTNIQGVPDKAEKGTGERADG